MSKRRNRNRGLGVMLWDTIESNWSVGKRFTADDVVAACGDSLVNARSVGRCLGWEIQRGRIKAVDKAKGSGSAAAVMVYTRTGKAAREVSLEPLPPEPAGSVVRTETKRGTTRVSFGRSWKPFRESTTARPWRGYESGLARVL